MDPKTAAHKFFWTSQVFLTRCEESRHHSYSTRQEQKLTALCSLSCFISHKIFFQQVEGK